MTVLVCDRAGALGLRDELLPPARRRPEGPRLRVLAERDAPFLRGGHGGGMGRASCVYGRNDAAAGAAGEVISDGGR